MADSQRAVANLLNNDQTEQGDGYIDNALLQSDGTPFSVNAFWVTEYILVSQGDYYYYNDLSRSSFAHINFYDSDKNRVTAVLQNPVMSREAFNLTKLTIPSGVSYIRMNIDKESTKNGLYKEKVPSYIAYPYGWLHSLRKLTTATETLTLPQTIYCDGTAATVSLKGNTIQNGTPTPSSPVPVLGVGELVGSDYQIPISSGQQTTNIYLGSTQTVRAIGKRVYDGTENWNLHGSIANLFYLDDYQDGYANNVESGFAISNTFIQKSYNTVAGLSNGQFVYGTPGGSYVKRILMKNTNCATKEDWIAYLAQQYASGTPVTVWYVLATATTGTVNEPLQKIGTYVDSISGISLPTTDGANSIDVDTTVQPSEFTATWTGWHDSSVKEWDGTDWN